MSKLNSKAARGSSGRCDMLLLKQQSIGLGLYSVWHERELRALPDAALAETIIRFTFEVQGFGGVGTGA